MPKCIVTMVVLYFYFVFHHSSTTCVLLLNKKDYSITCSLAVRGEILNSQSFRLDSIILSMGSITVNHYSQKLTIVLYSTGTVCTPLISAPSACNLLQTLAALLEITLLLSFDWPIFCTVLYRVTCRV